VRGQVRSGLGAVPSAANQEAPVPVFPLLEEAVAWARVSGHPDRVFHEERAAAYADVGKSEEAAEQERLSRLAEPGPFAAWEARPRPPRSDPGS
jgi:hypothetical protein